MATQSQTAGGTVLERLDVKIGAIAGVAAYVVGFVLMYVLTMIDGAFEDIEWEGVGQLLYNAQFVDSVNGEGFNMLTDSGFGAVDTDLPTVLYHLVPLVVLLIAGFVAANYAANVGSEIADSAIAGAAIVVGVLPLAIVGTFLFEANGIAPDLVMGVVLVGIVFPLVLGAVGGALANVVGE